MQKRAEDMARVEEIADSDALATVGKDEATPQAGGRVLEASDEDWRCWAAFVFTSNDAIQQAKSTNELRAAICDAFKADVAQGREALVEVARRTAAHFAGTDALLGAAAREALKLAGVD